MASTPRPLIWKNSTPISTGVDAPTKTIQYEDGDGQLFFRKDKRCCYRTADIYQGHWEDMILGSEGIDQYEKVKDIDIAQPVVNEYFICKIRVSNRPFLYKQDRSTGETYEKLISCIT